MIFIDIQLAQSNQAPLIHHVMIRAFMMYENAVPPSSALNETIFSIEQAMEIGEQAFIAYENDRAVGMVRFTCENNQLYFYRLSVLPENQGQGIAKSMLRALEDYAENKRIHIIQCNVRAEIDKNIALYQSIGYRICHEEILERENNTQLKIVSMVKYV